MIMSSLSSHLLSLSSHQNYDYTGLKLNFICQSMVLKSFNIPLILKLLAKIPCICSTSRMQQLVNYVTCVDAVADIPSLSDLGSVTLSK